MNKNNLYNIIMITERISICNYYDQSFKKNWINALTEYILSE